MTKIRWGILGCGRIAGSFAGAIPDSPGAELVAVGSRTQARADEFGSKHGVDRRHGSYEQLAADPNVDAIYVATPHPMHAADSILCLEHGKAILTEKPFTINAAEAERVFAAAQSANRFAMEAHWSRFLPLMSRLRESLNEGIIGEPRMLQADFGFRAGFDPSGRLFDPALGGGALLDVGCYCVSLAVLLFGVPNRITGVADIGSTGIDEQAAMVLGYPDGKLALLSTAVRTNTQHEAVICGTAGRIHMYNPWWKATDMTIYRDGKEPETITVPAEGNGFNYEVIEAMECISAGKLESATQCRTAQTIEIMRIMDTLREQWGVKITPLRGNGYWYWVLS